MALERALPDSEEYRNSGYYDLMVERYTIAQKFVKNKLVLDTCCGTGWGTFHYLSENSKFATGIDLSDEAINHYSFHKDNFKLLKMDALNLEFENNSFDVVIAFESIEHFSKNDAYKYITELKRVMKSDGFLIGSTPVCADKSLIPVLLEWNRFHKYVYTKRSLSHLLRSFFTLVYVHTLYNKTFPYFLFICENKITADKKEIRKFMQEFIHSRRDERRIRSYHYQRWSRELLVRRDRKNSVKLGIIALYQDPLSRAVWKFLIISFLPDLLINAIRKIRQRK